MKKKIYKVTVCFLLFALIGSSFAFASEDKMNTYSEYAYIEMLEKATDDDLSKLCLTREASDKIVKEYYTTLKTRGQMTNKQLEGFGYSKKEIELLKSYSAGKRITGNELKALSATCSGTLEVRGCGNKEAQFFYHWNWDKCPAITMTDTVGVAWNALDSDLETIGLIKTVTRSVNYYYGSTLVNIATGQIPTGINNNLDGTKITMLELYSMSDHPEYKYAKSGYVSVRLKCHPNVNAIISHIHISCEYGHMTLGVGAPSISVSMSSMAPSISFSIVGKITKMSGAAIHDSVIYSDGH